MRISCLLPNWLEISSECVRYGPGNGTGAVLVGNSQQIMSRQDPCPLCFASVEVSGPGAHLEAGWHLAHLPLQDLHLAVGLCPGEQRGLGYLRFTGGSFASSHKVCVCVCLPAEEAPADRWLARDGWAQTGRTDWWAGCPAGQICDLQLDQGPESSAWGGRGSSACLPSAVLAIYSTDLSHSQQSVWPGEPVAKALEDLQSAWRWGRAPNLQPAMEMVMWALVAQNPDKVRLVCFIFWTYISRACDSATLCLQDSIPQQWLMWKQGIQKTGLYINNVKILLVIGWLPHVFVSFQVPSLTFLCQVSYKLYINIFSNLPRFWFFYTLLNWVPVGYSQISIHL